MYLMLYRLLYWDDLFSVSYKNISDNYLHPNGNMN